MNGFRFGTFSSLENNGLLKNKNGESSFLKTMLAAAASGKIKIFHLKKNNLIELN